MFAADISVSHATLLPIHIEIASTFLVFLVYTLSQFNLVIKLMFPNQTQRISIWSGS